MSVEITAHKGKTGYLATVPTGAADLRVRRIQLGNPVLLAYRRMIDLAVAEAKKTRHGHPTDLALQERWWIQEFRPAKDNKELWFGSFPGCCEMLGLDADTERKRLLADIDDVLATAAVRHVADESYRRRAQVLSCAGVQTAIGRQFVLGLVAPDQYDEVAGVERPDPPPRSTQRPAKSRSRQRAAQN